MTADILRKARQEQKTERSWPIPADRVHAIARCWLVAAPLMYAWDLWGQARNSLTNGLGRPFGDDFINYWSGAWLAWHGRIADVYNFDVFHQFERALSGSDLLYYHYGYPPVLLTLTAPLALVPYVPGLALWLVSSWYAFYRALRLAAPDIALLLSLAVPALLVNAIGGQNGAWSAALLGGGLMLLDRRPLVAGLLFGLLVYKPHLGLLLPFALIAGRRWSAFASATLTVAGLVGVSLVLFGRAPWLAYAGNLAVLKHFILEDGTGVWHRMMSVFVMMRHFGFSVDASYIAQSVSAVVAAAVVARSWWRDDPMEIRYGLLVLGTCLATPYLQDYDLVVGAFIMVWLLTLQRQGMMTRTVAQVAMAAILLWPLMNGTVSKLTGFALGPLVIAPLFALFASRRPERARAL
jgi:hypothetical protein